MRVEEHLGGKRSWSRSPWGQTEARSSPALVGNTHCIIDDAPGGAIDADWSVA